MTEIKKILIIEDQECPLEALEDAVEQVMPNVTYEVARDINTARSKINNSQYDIVFVDHRLPYDHEEGLERNDFRFKVGTSKLREGKFFANLSIPVSENTELYSFGGISYRQGLGFGFLREPNEPKANVASNPNGFVPGIQSLQYIRFYQLQA